MQITIVTGIRKV